MKKILCILLALLMIASIALVACDKDEEPITDDDFDLDLDNTPTDTTDATTTEAVTTEPVSYEFTDVDETVYVKNCIQVNLRSTPTASTKDNIKGSLSFGDEKTYKRVKYNEVWSGLEIDGQIYYVNTEFLTTNDGFVVFEDVQKTIYAVNTKTHHGTKIYNFTDTDADGAVYTSVKHNTPLQVTGVSKDNVWYRINFTYTDNEGKTVTVENLYIVNGPYVSDTASVETAPAAQ